MEKIHFNLPQKLLHRVKFHLDIFNKKHQAETRSEKKNESINTFTSQKLNTKENLDHELSESHNFGVDLGRFKSVYTGSF